MPIIARRLVWFVLLAGALFPAGATAAPAPDAQPRIVGGQPASRAYPYQALLEINTVQGTARCGGALVAARFVVTAAHCMAVDGAPPQSIDVTLGATDVSTAPPNFSVTDFLVHPEFSGDPGNGFDVALVMLDRPADFEQLRLLRPADGGLWAAGITATVIGWGRTEDNQPGSSQLLEVQVPVFSDAGCAADFQAAGAPAGFFSPLTMVCAGGKEGRDACQGDSGGPLLVPDGARYALAGVVSFGAVLDGDGCANGLPGIYARVGADPLNAWIRSQIPLVEIDAVPAQPEPGQQVQLSVAARNPFGAYTSFAWDLDADGAFDDAAGASALVTAPRGVTTVGVRAMRTDPDPDLRDQETRHIDLDARFRSPVSFAAPAMTVTEGQPLTVVVHKATGGAGTVAASLAAGTAAIGGVDVAGGGVIGLAFSAEQAEQTLTVQTVDDRLVEGAETFSMELGGHTGELVPGAPNQLAVTVLDNDVTPRITGLTRSVRRKRGKIALRYRINTAATVSLKVADSRRHLLFATARRRHAKAGTYTTTLKLRRAALTRLRGSKTLNARATYAIFESQDLLHARVLKLRIRR